MMGGGFLFQVFGAVCTSSSMFQFWLEGSSRPSGTDQTHPERASLRITLSLASTKTGRR